MGRRVTSEYKTIKTETPPILRERDGRLFVVVVAGTTEIEAPLGEWFAGEFVKRVILPKVFER
jgi:hypothetical protein